MGTEKLLGSAVTGEGYTFIAFLPGKVQRSQLKEELQIPRARTI